ncbi:MAG: hypothetical protein RIQ79_110 [Verrucomicrobiota bacterium]
MRRDQQIRVNELLLQREELFLRIHSVETEVTRILGGPFPFVLHELPSARRVKRKVGDARPASAATAPRPVKSPAESLRRLETGEAGYRVTYRQFSKIVVEEHFEFEAVRTLLACQSAQLQVQKIETFTTDGSSGATLL